MNYLILALATWRVTSLLVSEDGPWFMFAKFRIGVGVRYDSDTLQPVADNVWASALLCMWCLSFWVGMFWIGLYGNWPITAIWAALPFALSAASIVLERVVRGA